MRPPYGPAPAIVPTTPIAIASQTTRNADRLPRIFAVVYSHGRDRQAHHEGEVLVLALVDDGLHRQQDAEEDGGDERAR